jgi:hypothetical protein
MQTTIREIIRPVSQTVVKHWLKTLSLPHSATNADDLCHLLERLIGEEKITLDLLRAIVLEIVECGEKRIYLGKLDNCDWLGNRSEIEKRAKGFGWSLSDTKTTSIALPKRPTLNYFYWSPEEIRIKFSEKHVRSRAILRERRFEDTEITNYIVISIEPGTGFARTFMDAPGTDHPYASTPKPDEAYVNTYLGKVTEIFEGAIYQPYDLLNASIRLAEQPEVFECNTQGVTTSKGGKHRFTTKGGLSEDAAYKGAAVADGNNWVSEKLDGYWLPDASGDLLMRRIFMHLDRKASLVRFEADTLAGEIEYAISRIRAF